MKLFSLDFPADELLARVRERLKLRGIEFEPPSSTVVEPAPRIASATTYHVEALIEHADSLKFRPPALLTTRGARFGQRLLHAALRPLANSLLAPQQTFNHHVRDAYAHLAADVERLERRLAALHAADTNVELPARRPKPPPGQLAEPLKLHPTDTRPPSRNGNATASRLARKAARPRGAKPASTTTQSAQANTRAAAASAPSQRGKKA